MRGAALAAALPPPAGTASRRSVGGRAKIATSLKIEHIFYCLTAILITQLRISGG
jgi:hypothetical protein